MFKSPYAKNPFDSVSNDELEEYKRIIDKKNKGETSPEPVIEDPGDTTDPGIVFYISHSFFLQVTSAANPLKPVVSANSASSSKVRKF